MHFNEIFTFNKLEIGDRFTCPRHRRIYKKISQCFAQCILTDEIFQFSNDEKVYKEEEQKNGSF